MTIDVPRACTAVLLAAAAGAVPAQEPAAPLETELEERIRVRLVILDVMVVDRDDRAVPGLTREDFVLVRDGERLPIDTLDLICPDGPTDDVRAVNDPARRPSSPPTGHPRRIVLAIDYQHFTQIQRFDILGRVKEMVEHGITSDDEIMIAALTGGLRIEQGFTRDRAEVLQTLDRMMYDISLWRDPFIHYSEHEFFTSVTTLADVLAAVDGPKAIVLLSNILADPRIYDASFAAVATAAVNARAVIYPVHAKGLTYYQHFGRYTVRPLESLPLARLAVETGGRFTEGTNDLSLGLARAQRDLGCRYAAGFYDDGRREDRVHHVKLLVRRPGLRVIHPEVYRFRSQEEQRESLLRSAWVAPGMFRSTVVRSHFFPLQPADAKHWDGLIAINFPVTIGERDGPDVVREIGALLERKNTVVHRFNRSITLRRTGGNNEAQYDVTLVEPVTLRAGAYTLRVLISDPHEAEPQSLVHRIELPRVPRGELFLVGPILGRRSDGSPLVLSAGTVVSGEAAEGDDLAPLLVQRIDGLGPLVTVTRACFVGSGKIDHASTVRRTLGRDGDDDEHAFPSVALELEGSGPVRCQSIVVDVPADVLSPGHYLFKTLVEREGEETLSSELRLAVAPDPQASDLVP